MAIVVEIISRSGTVVATHSFEQEQIVIGRGYNCQVILHDPHVDARHIILTRDSVTGALSCQDLQSLNGSWFVKANKKGSVHGRGQKIQGGARFFSGQVLQLGKSYLRISDSRHHLPDAIPISPWEETAHILGHWWLWATLATLLVALQVWNSYLSQPLTGKLSQHFLRACYPLLGALVYAGLFAFLGKNYKHDAKLSSHFSVALAMVLAISAIHFVAPMFAYWLRIVEFGGLARELLTMTLVFLGGYISLALAIPIKRATRVVTAAVAPIAILITLMINLLAQPEFKSYPNYDKNLVQPSWQLRSATDVDQFLTSANNLYLREHNNTVD